MNTKLIECVPNFSEGSDMAIIKQITDQIESVEGVSLLDVDPGKATNRTVVTFVGTPEEVIDAAFLAIKKACELIDMSKHQGEHPRFGATDVCPLVPVANISMEETVEYAHKLAERVGRELDFPVYCYEFAAQTDQRKNLASIRSGEYEGLPDKLSRTEWKPDFGPARFVPSTGVVAIGARNFLVAYNINLNTTSTRRANSVAFDVREAGRVLREGDPISGKIVKDEKGNKVRVAGSLKKVKAIGWYIEEYAVCQISMNLTDITITPVHVAYDEVFDRCYKRGLRVTGSELVGLIPLQAMLDAGRHFLSKQTRSLGVPDSELIKIAVKSMGLDELKPFIPEERIIEYKMAGPDGKPLVSMNLSAFVEETASESPAPGGGSIAAYMGAMGAALATMVANLSAHKRGWDERWEEFSEWAVQGKEAYLKLLYKVDEDTEAFNGIMDAFGLPKGTDDEKAARKAAIQEATKIAVQVPLETMKLAFDSMTVIKKMAEIGNPNSVSDAGVAALAARSAVFGAYLNVKINLGDLSDEVYKSNIIKEADALKIDSALLEKEILAIVESKI
ncbi:MAG: glutamate formimidoyltransferase [Bacteroidetes bacterium]|jgi:glutamate formiminotransferase / formiminotetrahydrofolate cyclodeaminase|nr:glutamate formimidoyltransferase [Bacteroidota bacterium]MBT4401417.1 glutamate formimidoyltransferase [Bacteroidota bacterium]MBT5427823.1 glutamate formimidoyltransferase [Bacteroidota bacterium]MBT7093663.1 glutamate formimidoyltransferase [Bacteroidota bacterium]MBT7464234.1 glutamate formimidoyltransferase [Bacteroidota bacterium]